jgi:hypothetical protein
MQTRSKSKATGLQLEAQPVPTKSSPIKAKVERRASQKAQTEPAEFYDSLKWVDFYDPQDNLTRFTQKILPILSSAMPNSTLAEKKKQAKDAFYSIDLVSIMRKPHKNAKLYNHYDVSTPNEEHQCDLLVLPNDSGFRYILVVIDVASRYRECKPLRFKTANACADALKSVYDDKDCPLKPPVYMRTDQGSEFKAAFAQYLQQFSVSTENNNVIHLYRQKSFHLPFVERVNQELARRIFKVQSLKELNTSSVSKQWINLLPGIVYDMNHEKHSATKIEPYLAIHLRDVPQMTKDFDSDLTSMHHKVGTKVRRLLNNDEILDIPSRTITVGKRRATDPVWSMEVYTVASTTERDRSQKGKLTMHKLTDSKDQPYPHTFTYWRLQPVSG